jgi:hypothetical protein
VIFTLTSDLEAQRLWIFLKDRWRKAASDGKPFVVEVVPATAPQTRKQQRRYRAILRMIAADAWVDGKQHSADWWAGHFASEFIGIETDEFGVIQPMSSAELNVHEMNDYMLRIEQFATEVLQIELQLES